MRRAALLGAALALLATAGCGDDAPEPQGGPLTREAALQTATCRDWNEASAAQRSNTVDRLEEVAAGPRREGGTLPDALGHDTLDARCKPGFAKGFLLYELDNRAAAFRSLVDRPG